MHASSKNSQEHGRERTYRTQALKMVNNEINILSLTCQSLLMFHLNAGLYMMCLEQQTERTVISKSACKSIYASPTPKMRKQQSRDGFVNDKQAKQDWGWVWGNDVKKGHPVEHDIWDQGQSG